MRLIKHFAILFAVFAHVSSFTTEANEIISVDLSYSGKPALNGNPKPSKAPADLTSPLNAYLDVVAGRLLFENSEGVGVTFCIYDNDGYMITSGSFNGYSYSLNLNSLITGLYVLHVECNGTTFEGIFEL